MANALTSLLQFYTVNQTYLPHHYDEKARMRKKSSGEEKKESVVLGETAILPKI